jgi:hypothetical protein
VKSADFLKPRDASWLHPSQRMRPDQAFRDDVFWFWSLGGYLYRQCYTIVVNVTIERFIVDVDDEPGPFKHIIDFDPTVPASQTKTQIGSGPESGLNPMDDQGSGTWGWGPIAPQIAVLLGLPKPVTAVNQKVVDDLGRIASTQIDLPPCVIKGTQIMESTSEAPTAKYASTSNLDIVATVEEDGSLSDAEATYAIDHTGLMLSDSGDCEYTSTGEGIGLVVTGKVEGKVVSLTVEGQVTLHSEYSCAPPSDTTFPLGENAGFVRIEGELVDGQLTDEQTFTDGGTTTVVTSVVEVTVEEDEPVG